MLDFFIGKRNFLIGWGSLGVAELGGLIVHYLEPVLWSIKHIIASNNLAPHPKKCNTYIYRSEVFFFKKKKGLPSAKDFLQ